MKAFLDCLKVYFFIGCLVLLGLHVAAQGLEKISPEIPHRVFSFSAKNDVCTVVFLEREYSWNARETIKAAYLGKTKAKEAIDHVTQKTGQAISRGFSFLAEKYQTYAPQWTWQSWEPIFNWKIKNISP